jgi:hypothetical protein
VLRAVIGWVVMGWVEMGLLAGMAHADAPTAPEESRLGQDLFVGRIDMHGRIRTHLVDLPPEVVRCGNCHAAGDGPDVPRSLAPRLTRNLLLEPLRRRGGPVSRYDQDKFCTLLRKGFDPAYVLISLEMPLYTIDDANCRALWLFLTGSAHAQGTH